MQQKNKPPRKPSIVFLGETDTNNFCLPILLPTINAKVSFTHTSIKHPRIKLGLYSLL